MGGAISTRRARSRTRSNARRQQEEMRRMAEAQEANAVRELLRLLEQGLAGRMGGRRPTVSIEGLINDFAAWLGSIEDENSGERVAAGAANAGAGEAQCARTADVHNLPLETYITKEELEKMSVRDLKVEFVKAARQRGRNIEMELAGCLEKKDLILALQSLRGGSSQHECCVCLSSYLSGDCLRVLPCGHRFHVECVDKWLLKHSGCCPLCTAPIASSTA